MLPNRTGNEGPVVAKVGVFGVVLLLDVFHRTLLDGVGVGAGAASGSDQGGGGGRAGGITCVARLPCVRGSAGMINPSRPLPRTKPVGLCVSSTTITLNHPT